MARAFARRGAAIGLLADKIAPAVLDRYLAHMAMSRSNTTGTMTQPSR
jgi:hypothetical protein